MANDGERHAASAPRSVTAAQIRRMGSSSHPDARRLCAARFGQGGDTARIRNGADIDDLQLVASRPATIRGRIAFTESATSAPPPRPTVFDMGAVREWMIGQQVRSPAKIKDDGTFEISLQPGHVLIRGVMTGGPAVPPPGPNGPSPWRIRRVLMNDADVADTGIDATAGATVENVVVEFTNRVSSASGGDRRRRQDRPRLLRHRLRAGSGALDGPDEASPRPRPAQDDLFHARWPGDYYVVAMSDVEVNA
jgi:hypothetical protein